MLNCRRCGSGTKVVAEEPAPPERERGQTVRMTRECVGCGARAETTEAWSDEDTAEFYRAKYEQAGKWIGGLALLLEALATAAKMADDGVRQDLDWHTAGVGQGKTGDSQGIAFKGQRKNGRRGRCLIEVPTPLSGFLEAVEGGPERGRLRTGHRRGDPRPRQVRRRPIP